MVLPHLLLQKSYPLAKTWDHVERLLRYLSLWKTDDINNLLIEVRTIHTALPSAKQQECIYQQ